MALDLSPKTESEETRRTPDSETEAGTPDRMSGVSPVYAVPLLHRGQLAGAQRRALIQSAGHRIGNRAVQRMVSSAPRSASAGPDGGPLEEDLTQRIQAERSNGTPLDAGMRQSAELAVGQDLSLVRIHTGSNAAALNKEVGARAFTTGRDIFFGENASPSDPDVLLHEVTHTVQQGMGEEAPSAIGAAGTSHEQEAEHTAQSHAPGDLAEEDADTGQRLIQRFVALEREDDDDNGSGVQDGDGGAGGETFGEVVEGSYQLSQPEPISVPPEELGPGDFPEQSDSDTAMALRLSDGPAVQRDDDDDDDDDTPSLSGDASGGVTVPIHTPPGATAPGTFSASGTIIIRDFNILKFQKIDLGHEPSWQWTFDSKGQLQQQLGITLINLHWVPPWQKEIEVGVSAFMQSSVLPQPGPFAPGGQVQIEQHIVPWLSLTLNFNGAYDPGSGQMATSGGIGLLFHAPKVVPVQVQPPGFAPVPGNGQPEPFN